MKKKGVTLIELVATMVVIAILALIAFVALEPYKGIKLRTAAEKLSLDLLYTRNLALATVKWYGVSFEADPANSYIVYETDGTTDTLIKDPSLPGKDFIINIKDVYDGVMISQVQIAGGNKIEFDPMGTPFPDKGATRLTVEAAVVLSYRGLTAEVRVTPRTGRSYIQ